MILSCWGAAAQENGPSRIEAQLAKPPHSLRIASFNINLARGEPGKTIAALRSGTDAQALAVAEIIQRVRPDILFVNELDFDPEGTALALFADLLRRGQNGALGIDYPHELSAPVNTGSPSGLDLDRNGKTYGPGDAFGWGLFEGQFGMAVLSTAPLSLSHSFQHLRMAEAPWVQWPKNADGSAFYSEEAASLLRLSSKSHWIVETAGLSLLLSHPTPPVFDGPEDRNGVRNAAEIGLWTALLEGEALRDDAGALVRLPEDARPVVMGDLNADPLDGDGRQEAIAALLAHPLLQDPLPRSEGAALAATLQGGVNAEQLAPPDHDTADWKDSGKHAAGNLRVDYVLPAASEKVLGSGVFWPTQEDPLFRLVGEGKPVISSDHRLVWVDIAID
ncbi:MAG: endonuclease/exonuclease/phosphatase family protein [Neomegalonema sp.]|nr:endonuclease/exonuclease/phosphatase family protein [Neomegalonema sp.]